MNGMIEGFWTKFVQSGPQDEAPKKEDTTTVDGLKYGGKRLVVGDVYSICP